MSERYSDGTRGGRRFALAGITVAGLVGIVGSGVGFPPMCWDYCGPVPPFLYVGVLPQTQVVQVGGTATFAADATGSAPPPYSYAWCRAPAPGAPCVEIPGATGSTYTLAGANLADEGAVFGVTARSSDAAGSSQATLHVTAVPPLVFDDGEFLPADWTASAATEPAGVVSTHAEDRITSGGNPGAFGRLAVGVPAASGNVHVRVYHLSQTAVHDPATQGAILALEFAQDGASFSPTVSYSAYTSPLIAQGDRKYRSMWSWYDRAPEWTALPATIALFATDFMIVEGPPCAATEACPDFSAGAPPLHFGFTRDVDLVSDTAAVEVVHGVDNWRVTVWRR
jgi:hypothetical protein